MASYAKQTVSITRNNKVVPKAPKVPKLNLKEMLNNGKRTLKDVFYGKRKNKR